MAHSQAPRKKKKEKKGDGLAAWLTYAGIRVLIGMLRCFPANWNMVTARTFARIWWRAVPRHRQRARAHIRLAFGDDLPDAEVERLAKGSFEQLAMFAIDFIFVPHLVTEWTWRKYVRLVNMENALQTMLRAKSVLLLTGHFGNWELAGYMLALFGFKITAIMRPLDNVYINRWVVGLRKKRGLELLDKKGATEHAERILADGGSLGFIADQNAGRKGMFVDFFGVAASTYKSIGLLAMQADAPIIIGYALRTGHRLYYEIGVERIIRPEEWKAQDDPLRWITQEYTSAIEATIRRAPEQYLWIHRRWKSRPRHEKTPPAALAEV